jgi:hypothetical protein
LHRGRQIKGFKLVSYTPARKWVEGAEQELEDCDDLWVRKLLTPTQALKVLGDEPDESITEMIEVPDKRPIVAPEGDRRKDWTGKPPEQMFEDEGDE